MAVKVNFVLDDDVKSDLDRLVTSGMRSRIINEALRKELLHIQRQKLAKECVGDDGHRAAFPTAAEH